MCDYIRMWLYTLSQHTCVTTLKCRTYVCDYIHVWLHTFSIICMWLHICVAAYMRDNIEVSYIHVWLEACVAAYRCDCIYVWLHTCVAAYMRDNIRALLHAFVTTYTTPLWLPEETRIQNLRSRDLMIFSLDLLSDGDSVTHVRFCMKIGGLPRKLVWYVWGLPWKLVGNFGSGNCY